MFLNFFRVFSTFLIFRVSFSVKLLKTVQGGGNGVFPLLFGAFPLLEVFGASLLILSLKKVIKVLGSFREH